MDERRVESTQSHANLILLAVGLLVGLLAGPFVLGRLSPSTYAKLFEAGEAQQKLEVFEEDAARRLHAAKQIGVTGEYLPELQREIDVQRRELTRARDAARARNVQSYMTAVLLALVAIMVVEALQSHAGSLIARRLTTIRYALAAIWLALLLAVPQPLLQVSMLFVGLLIAIALIVGLIPLGRGINHQGHQEHQEGA